MREVRSQQHDGHPRRLYCGLQRPRRTIAQLTGMLLISCVIAFVVSAFGDDKSSPRRIDPAAWGTDHVGKPLPSYVTGDECLFCHRTIGPAWGDNRHQLTIRPAGPDDPAIATLRQIPKGDELADETRYLMGSKRITRFLKRSKDYGKLDILSASCIAQSGSTRHEKLQHVESPHWNTRTFAARCAGCHATAVNTQTRAFSATSLDCFACHGDVPLEHTKDASRVFLSGKNRTPRQVISICSQCHLRGGKSKSSKLPYPNTFVAGDNLFRDFQVDLSDEAIKALPPIDQHIFLNARDVAVFGQASMTCLTCHDVHGQSSEKHQRLGNAMICSSCHVPGTDNSKLRDAILPSNQVRSHSRVCDY